MLLAHLAITSNKFTKNASPTTPSFIKNVLMIATTWFSSQLGSRPYMSTPPKMASSVAYPFALIKPCGVQGDTTLKDINRRIHSPFLLKEEQAMGEDPLQCYPTSAFSGKPVVVKTKIRTEGGKGSITIMRTKGWHGWALVWSLSRGFPAWMGIIWKP